MSTPAVRLACAAFALAAAGTAAAAPLALPAPPAAVLAPHLGEQLPLQQVVRASNGQESPLGRYFDGSRPVVLVPGYYTCTQLCGLVMHGVLESLARSGLPASQWRVVGFSIDPADTPAQAKLREAADRDFARFLDESDRGMRMRMLNAQLDLLTADPPTVEALVRAVGYSASAAPDGQGIDHAAGFAIATPDGRIARYFQGIRFDPGELRLALVEASGGQVGTLGDRLVLLCSHYDPATGRYTTAVMGLLRVLGAAGVVAGGAWILRRRHGRDPSKAART